MHDELLDDVWVDDTIFDEGDSKPISPTDYRKAFLANSAEKSKFPDNLSFLRQATRSFTVKYNHREIQSSTIQEVNSIKNRNAIKIATYINRCTHVWSLILKDMELSFRRCTMYKNRRKARDRVQQHIRDLKYYLESISSLTPESCKGGAAEILSLVYNQQVWMELKNSFRAVCIFVALDILIYEVKMNEEFLMSSLFVEAELQLAHLGLAELKEDNLDVIVGGLGLGYTAFAALENQNVASLKVIDVMAQT